MSATTTAKTASLISARRSRALRLAARSTFEISRFGGRLVFGGVALASLCSAIGI